MWVQRALWVWTIQDNLLAKHAFVKLHYITFASTIMLTCTCTAWQASASQFIESIFLLYKMEAGGGGGGGGWSCLCFCDTERWIRRQVQVALKRQCKGRIHIEKPRPASVGRQVAHSALTYHKSHHWQDPTLLFGKGQNRWHSGVVREFKLSLEDLAQQKLAIVKFMFFNLHHLGSCSTGN